MRGGGRSKQSKFRRQPSISVAVNVANLYPASEMTTPRCKRPSWTGQHVTTRTVSVSTCPPVGQEPILHPIIRTLLVHLQSVSPEDTALPRFSTRDDYEAHSFVGARNLPPVAKLDVTPVEGSFFVINSLRSEAENKTPPRRSGSTTIRHRQSGQRAAVLQHLTAMPDRWGHYRAREALCPKHYEVHGRLVWFHGSHIHKSRRRVRRSNQLKPFSVHCPQSVSLSLHSTFPPTHDAFPM